MYIYIYIYCKQIYYLSQNNYILNMIISQKLTYVDILGWVLGFH